MCKRTKLDPYLTHTHKLTQVFNWIKDLNVRQETIKLLEEKTGSRLLGIGLGGDILNLTTKAKNKQVGLHQIKMLLHTLAGVAKQSLVRLLAKAHAWVAGQVPS